MTTSQFEETDDLKELNRYMWGSGDYESVAALVIDDAEALLDDAGVTAGCDVLDVATGTGNVAVAAAQRGARVIGLDLTPEHFDVARRRSAAAGVEVEWVEGDAEQLPYASDSFDRVFSTFGAQFAPRHQLVAQELYRVCRPGGTIGMCNWTDSGWTGRFTAVTARYFPKPPSYVLPPMAWGSDSYVRALFEPLGGVVETELRTATYEFASLDEFMEFFQTNFGPWIVARRSITPRSRWEDLLSDLRAMTASFDVGTDTFIVRPEYARVLVRKPSSSGGGRV